mmetsp:Transcript_33307/g.74644  ORF Transcript_33307/g.74644 Transcript_33307/m.74644 type:complete len:106 (+) Transcript_33307:72-389(+)
MSKHKPSQPCMYTLIKIHHVYEAEHNEHVINTSCLSASKHFKNLFVLVIPRLLSSPAPQASPEGLPLVVSLEVPSLFDELSGNSSSGARNDSAFAASSSHLHPPS